jgi:hypothetical protein
VSRIRAWADGLGWYVGTAGVLLTFALLWFLLILQSSNDRLLWLGSRVIGQRSEGTISYEWHGQSYLIAAPGAADDPHVAVYLDPSNPSKAITNSVTTRVLDASVTLLPAAAAMGVVTLGVVRRRRRELRASDAAGTFGTGLDPEFVQRQLEQLRRPPT